MLELKEVPFEAVVNLLKEAEPEFMRLRDEPEVGAEERVRRWHAARQAQAMLCLRDGRTVGFTVARYADPPDTVAIGPMYIRPEFRRQGAGVEQVRLFLEWAMKRGFTKVETRTWGANRASQHILEKLGFAATARRAGDRAGGDTTILYEWRR